MHVGILGTGNLAVALGKAWLAAGRAVVLTGRDADRVRAAAAEIGAEAVAPDEFAARAGVVLVAVAYDGLAGALSLVGADRGGLGGKTVLDCTNAVDYATGRLRPASGSAAEFVARHAPGAHVVKALHLFAGTSWPHTGPRRPVVALCGDDPGALGHAAELVADLGGEGVVVGGLDAARQLEEAAGFVMRVVAAGANPRLAVPDVEPRRVAPTG
ncbi:NAD(P)-binding domain-containing protein [Amycolatopsis sp. NEAU-NG30]|uniref:NAD(P)-binding domain-containing protein n=1 Tax=Amycolatopsis melonis TaxID=3156488 RepID=A0ABV0LGY8_9PSEU